METEQQKPAAALDLGSFDQLTKAQDDGMDVVILHPANRKPIGLTIRVAGPDSERQRAARREITDARLARRNLKIPTATELEDEGLQLLAGTVMSWSFAPGVVIDGSVPEFSTKNVEALFRRFPFIREQVDNAAAERAGFLKS